MYVNAERGRTAVWTVLCSSGTPLLQTTRRANNKDIYYFYNNG